MSEPTKPLDLDAIERHLRFEDMRGLTVQDIMDLIRKCRELQESILGHKNTISATAQREAEHWDEILKLRQRVAELEAESALAEAEKPYRDPIFHFDSATHITTVLPAEIGDALRLADDLASKILSKTCSIRHLRDLATNFLATSLLRHRNKNERGLGE